MNIIEQISIPKSPTKANEDGIVITNDFIAVIDGSTSKTTRRHSSRMSNGRYAMTLVADYIRHMPAPSTCHEFCVGVTKKIYQHYLTPVFHAWHREKRLQQLLQHPEERMTASAVVFNRLRREIWLVGDCHCLIDGAYFDNPKPYEDELAEIRARRAKQLLANGMTIDEMLRDDPARQAMIPRMLETMKEQNSTYAVIDGFTIPEHKVPIITLGFQSHELVLASDGYPFLRPTLAESEQLLMKQKSEDPMNIGTFKATKGFFPDNHSFDDRTYIRFQV